MAKLRPLAVLRLPLLFECDHVMIVIAFCCNSHFQRTMASGKHNTSKSCTEYGSLADLGEVESSSEESLTGALAVCIVNR